MHLLANKILKHKTIVLVSFILVTIVSLILAKGVHVNYNMMDYLPEDSSSTVALDVMNESFDTAPPNLRILVKDVSVPEALEYKKHLSQVEGVEEITWLDDTVDINQPLEMIESKTLDSYYKGNNALFTVLVDTENDLKSTISDIRKITGEKGAISGEAVNINSAKESAGSEVSSMMLFIVPMILFILLITTSSWFEPVLFLLAIGVAILQ